MLHYIPPPAELSEVDERFHELNLAQQLRVAELMITVDRVPMRLAVDAVLMSEEDTYDTRRASASLYRASRR